MNNSVLDNNRSHNLTEAMDNFVSSCRQKGLSVTPQRLALYRAIFSTTKHPTAEMLYEEVRETMPTISAATVYKAIETFKELAVIREIPVPDEHRMRLDANLRSHHHLLCLKCRSLMDLHLDLLENLSIPKEALKGFEIVDSSLLFSGYCEGCRKSET